MRHSRRVRKQHQRRGEESAGRFESLVRHSPSAAQYLSWSQFVAKSFLLNRSRSLSQFAFERRYYVCEQGRAGIIVGTAQVLNRSMTVQESSSEHWDEAEFRAVFLQHYARIVAILVRLLGDRLHAEEVAIDTLWRLYPKPALQVDGNVGGWCRSPGSPV